MSTEENKTILTDEEVELLENTLNEIPQDPALKILNNTDEYVPEQGELKAAMIKVDPITGEQSVIGTVDPSELDNKKSFEDICDEFEEGALNAATAAIDTPITVEELSDYINKSKDDTSSIVKDLGLFNGEVPDTEVIMKLLDIANRRLKKEDFNVYKELPESVKNTINKYIGMGGVATNNSNQTKMLRNMIAESLIDDFATSITVDRIQTDLNKEIEDLFNQGSEEIADSVIGYTTERNSKYREYAAEIEDPEKREQMIKILDQIDEAYNLSQLKEYCKKCKIKHIELEKCTEKSYKINQFLAKYDDSQYNIYSLYTAEQALLRNLQKLNYECTEVEVRAFMLAFCDQCKNYTPSDVLQHSYMYYVIYNIILADINTGDKKEVSDKFLNNVIECIENLKIRNNNFK